MGKVRHLQRALAEANAENAQLRHALAEAQTHGWTLQMVCAAILEKLTDDGAVVLTVEERRPALEEEWGIETSVLDKEEYKPMIVRIVKGASK